MTQAWVRSSRPMGDASQLLENLRNAKALSTDAF